jgi:hypothetical protein
MSLPEPFASPDHARAAFLAGLERQLAEPGLGTFILVLANAAYDPDLWPRLEAGIAERFAALGDEVRAGLRGGAHLAYPDDDLFVFLKLMAMGLDVLAGTRYRRLGPWEAQYNAARALRPARASGLRAGAGAPPPFAPGGFHFNKPFLAKEILWQGELLRRPCRLLYNKFPFAPWHGLLVPEAEREHAQDLSQEMHLFAWHCCDALGTRLPGFGLSYNAYGAHASVNHLHFQTFLRPEPLPVEVSLWRHNGGAADYPALCARFDDALEAWLHIAGLRARGLVYNLVYRPGHLYCLARRPQGEYPPAPWSAGHAWYEMAGGVVAFNRADFEALDEAAPATELRRTRPN